MLWLELVLFIWQVTNRSSVFIVLCGTDKIPPIRYITIRCCSRSVYSVQYYSKVASPCLEDFKNLCFQFSKYKQCSFQALIHVLWHKVFELGSIIKTAIINSFHIQQVRVKYHNLVGSNQVLLQVEGIKSKDHSGPVWIRAFILLHGITKHLRRDSLPYTVRFK